jgi:hypothetical protein
MADGISSGEPSFCHTVLDMMHVDAPSSMMQQMNCDVPDFNRYLESYQSGEMGFPTIKIKGDESSVSRVDCPQGGK